MFPAIMKFENIHKRASRLSKIVEAWQKNGSVSRIERDIALDELRYLYNEISDLEADSVATSAPMSAAEESTVVVAVATPVVAESAVEASADIASEAKPEELVELDDDVLDIDALLGLTPIDSIAPSQDSELTVEVVAEPTPVPATEVVAEPTPEPTAEPEPTPEPEPEVVVASMSDGKLFAEEDIPKVKRSERKIVSLYATSAVGTTAAAASTTATAAATVAQSAAPVASAPSTPSAPSAQSVSEVKPAVAPIEEQPKRLVDVLGSSKRVLADKVAEEEMPTTPFNRITDLRKAIGINDKFLMIKDLFGGNAELYNTTIDSLNGFDDLDDCMIYIAENFSWNPDSAGAKLLVSLIERKLG